MARKNLLLSIIIVLLITSLSIDAQLHLTNIGNFITEGGDTLFNCKIGYRTHGTLNHDSSNVIIYPTWFGGTSEHIDGLVGQDKLVDDTKFYIIVIDALGNGVSSSPSNYEGPNRFPEITINDMVTSQHYLLQTILGFENVYGAIGGSMGGMQVFEWVTAYPDYIKKAVAYVTTPQPTSYDLLQWNIRLEIIDSFRTLNAGEQRIWKLLDMQSSLLARSPGWLVENVDAENIDKYLSKFDGIHDNQFTIDNYRTQLKAMLTHNIYRHFDGSMGQTIDVVKAEMFIMVSETDHLVNPESAEKFASASGSKLELLKNNSGHLGVGAELEYCGKLIRNFFSN